MKPDKINKLIKRLAAVSLWLIIWQIASVMTGLELLLASPVTVLRTLAGMLVTRQFYGILYLSVNAYYVGYACWLSDWNMCRNIVCTV